ncbi:hypothetical protein [Yoonia sp. 208BN28-4]|uniref:hypothetical protein n=1 Tax=Yoonia sp. 208BN28-4 TaxID=3126505 RepID=UPI00309B7D38
MKRTTQLLGATALTLIGAAATAQDAVNIPVGANTEPATAPALPVTGFVISVNGNAIAGDRQVVDIVRQTDVQIANADVQVTFDGLGAEPRLDLETVGAAQAYRAGEVVTIQSALNYPAYVTRGELRVVDRGAAGGPRTVLTAPIDPNGRASITVPQGRDLVVVHRVYDGAGRFDETRPLALSSGDNRPNLDGVEEGVDSAAVRNIPVAGGAVTVSGENVARGANVVALGEAVQASPDGSFVIQRILPAGDYGVDVAVNGAGQNVNLIRDVTIPASEWFYVATADLTFGLREDGQTGERESYQTGRIAGYVDGRTDTGVQITASIDTGEGDLDTIFQGLDERDPRQLLLRVDPEDLYPTYGDDSTLVDNTPTSGKLYLRIEQDGNYVQWGDFDATLGDNEYVSNDRTLYGLQGVYATRATTTRGDAQARVLAYAAQPGRLPQRDTFLGTGGSVFFLEKQDIAAGSDQLEIQLRDPDTGRVIETRTLVAGQDYAINYIQGIVTLTRPLASDVQAGLVQDGAIGNADAVLVAAYEHTPVASDLEGFAYGARAEGWVTDTLRFGVVGQLDETGVTDHRVIGADILYQPTADTFVRLDYAQSEGTGFGSTFSPDGGLIVQEIAGAGSEGEAFKLTARASLADFGVAADGSIGAYFERRTEGFASLDTQVTSATGDETFWGIDGDVAITDQLHIAGAYESYENDAGETKLTGAAEVTYRVSDRIAYAVGIESQDRTGGTSEGSRTDLAARVTFTPNDQIALYVFGQGTIARENLRENNRYGLGGAYDFGNGWSIAGELSDGTLGEGGLITATYADEAGNTRYLGYEVDPGRELDGIALRGRDRGRIVAGATTQVSDTVNTYGETSYDLFGDYRSLISAYGVTYTPNDTWSLTSAIEVGRVRDDDRYDFDRNALSFGTTYQDTQLSVAGRVEYRTEDGLRDGTQVNSDTLLVSADAVYKITEEQRFVFSADVARSETDQSDLLDGNYANVVLGYAFRPVEDDRLNVLARYRYLYDLYGLRDAEDEDEGPRQRSHVLSVDASYDLNETWTIGGKLGYRSAETSPDGTSDFAQNDAWLAVASARYHMVHNWDALVEVRSLNLVQAETQENSVLGAVYRHINPNVKVGVGYNFGTFSDDLTDLTYDDQGVFINLIAKF